MPYIKETCNCKLISTKLLTLHNNEHEEDYSTLRIRIYIAREKKN